MSIIIPANSAVGGGYDVANSARFNSGSSDSLTRTFATPTNAKKFTISQWVKRTKINESQILLNQGADYYYFVHNNEIDFETSNGRLKTNRLFRDTNAWYHIVIVVDTTLGTADDRIKMFINGVQETSFGSRTNPSLNANFANFNSANEHSIAKRQSASDMFLNGYLAEQVFLDGTAAAITDLGEFDEDSGIWKPIDVSGLTFGTNGFYLDFQASGNLGNDANGGTDLTENNIVATDQSTDTCTLNYNVMNPLDNFYSGATFSEGNIKVSSARYAGVTSTFALTKGKWYFEYKCVSRSSTSGFVGITSATATATNYEFGNQSGENVGYSVSLHNGSVYGNGGQVAASGTFESINGGDFGMVALDFDNNKMYFGRNGTWGNSQNPANGTNALSIVAVTQGASGHWRIYVGGETNNATVFEMNFGSPPYAISSGNTDGNGYGNFEYAVPSGYYALNTKNLAEYG